MAFSKIEEYILKDDVKSAVTLIDNVLRESKNVEGTALQVLNILSSALAKCTRNNHVCKSEIQHIYKLADTCCKVLNKTWKCNHSAFMQCIYFICQYFIEQKDFIYSRKLTLFFFEVKKNSKLPWNKDQKNILIHIFKDFINSSFNENNPNVFGTEETSVISKWNFMFSLWELNGYENKFLIFNALSKLLSKISDASIAHRLGVDIFNQFCSVANAEFRGQTVIVSQKDFENLIHTVDNYFWAMRTDDLKNLDHSNLISFLQSVDIQFPLKSNSVIKSMITSISAFHQVEKLDFEKIKDDIVNYLCPHKELNIFTRKMVCNLFQIISTNKVDGIKLHGDTLLKFVSILKNVSISINSNLKKVEVADNSVNKIVIQALQVISNFREDKEMLDSYFQPVIQLIKYFFDSKNLTADKSKQHLGSAVFFFAKILMSLFKHGLYTEAVQLAKDLIINLRKVEFDLEPAEQLKSNVNIIICMFVKSSPPANYSYECLLYLLALSQDQNPLFRAINSFKHWCDLKLCPNNNVKEVTTFQIISFDINKALESEDVLSWPFSIVPSFDFENLLLCEIQAYMKHKDLMECAMDVYKTAVGHVKNKLILARIVCCATRAVIETSSKLSIFTKFLQTVHNMIKVVSKANPSELDEIDKCLVLGDLYHWLARHEITLQRMDAQSQVVNMYPKVEVDPNIPVPEDPLNCTVVLNEYSFISYNTQEKVMANLSRALEAWHQALSMVQKLKGDKLITYELSILCSLKYMKEQGYIYRLYKDVKQEAIMWQLMFDISRVLNISKYRIIAFSELLCVLTFIDQRTVNEMKDYVASQPDIDNYYYFYLFHIALGKNSLINRQSIPNLEFLDENKIKSWPLVQVQFNLLKYFLSSSQGTQCLRGSRELIRLFDISLRHSTATINNFLQQTVAQCLLFDISLMIGKYFCRAKDVRLARLYSHKQLEMAQQLHLPLRTCEFLTLQAEIDYLCANTSDLSNKLRGIETILELSHQGIRYDMHSEECKCLPCGHIEYQIALAYAILLKTGLYKLQQDSVDCFASLKDCWELLSKIKKRFNRNYVSEYMDCDIMFNVMAVEVFIVWGKTDKASKYSGHALKSIERSYKPFRFERFALSCRNIKIKQSFPKLSSSAFFELTEDEELESSSTPIAPLELHSPPPIGCKMNSLQEGDKNLIQTKKRLLKKLVFNLPSKDKNVYETRKPKTPLTCKNIYIENQKNVIVNSKKNTSPLLKSTVPDIIVTTDSEGEPLSPRTLKINDGFLKPFGTNGKLNNMKKKTLVTPKKALVSVFCDQDEKSTKSLPKRTRKKCMSPYSNVKKIPVITIDSDEEEFDLFSTQKRKGKGNFTKEPAFISVPTGKLSPRKKLFGKQDKSDDSCSSANSNCNPLTESDDIQLLSSSDEASIINATVYEEPKNSLSIKLQLASTPQLTQLEDKMSNLGVTPSSPLAQPLFINTVRKYSRRVKLNSDRVNEKEDIASPNIAHVNQMSHGIESDMAVLENEMSNLCVTPTHSLGTPLASTTVRKYTRRQPVKADNSLKIPIHKSEEILPDIVKPDKNAETTSSIPTLGNETPKLCVTPTSPLAQPLPTTTVKKYSRRAKVKTNGVFKSPEATQDDFPSVNIALKKNILPATDSFLTPVTVRKTRSSRKLALSTTKINRI